MTVDAEAVLKHFKEHKSATATELENLGVKYLNVIFDQLRREGYKVRMFRNENNVIEYYLEKLPQK